MLQAIAQSIDGTALSWAAGCCLVAGAASSSESDPTVWNWRLRPWTSSRARARAAASPPSSDEDEDEEELLLLELLLDERPIVTRRRGAAFTRLLRGAARLLIHGARLRSPLLPRRLSAAQASAAQTGAIVLSEAAARSGVSAAAATRSELSEIASGNRCGLEVARFT